ncbi:hypothetical protein BG844_32435 [Couchioplanes caeruleus subsp. caeruleus]|uniref:DUF11 domain-containing protein n=1 Tax=Couchioplanes caeruleus subsp. caeruleus TaxID=56427 RepID=A0A1K0FC84_9ACTN|nr:hypothetical protein BG844_32435 [Couchioplanes caeruleus subsp. caeruleus]
MLAATVAIGVTLAGASAADANSAAATLSGAATGLVYGQPDVSGTRSGTNTLTLTNNGTGTIQFPMLTFPANGRDTLLQDVDCEYMSGSSTRTTCIVDPLAGGESRTMTLPWQTRASGPAGTAEVRIEQAVDSDGTPVAGTASTLSFKVGFERLTGTFSITATPLTYGERDRYGIRHGYTNVTITNLSSQTVQFPLVTFPASSGDASYMAWKGCTETIQHVEDIVCVERPLAPGQKRTAKFWFHTVGPVSEFDASVRVDAGADASGAVVDATAAGTTYRVTSPGDAN